MTIMLDPQQKIPRVAVLLILLVLGGVALAMLSPDMVPATEPAPAPPVEEYAPQRMTLEGELVCLPHVDTEGPQTDECAIGLRTDDGTHYAFDTLLMSSMAEPYQVGDRVSGNGVFTPIERLSTDYWRKYQIKGIFSVTDGFRVMRSRAGPLTGAGRKECRSSERTLRSRTCPLTLLGGGEGNGLHTTPAEAGVHARVVRLDARFGTRCSNCYS